MSSAGAGAAAAGASDKRVGWIDAARGIGITLVVLGHVDRGLMSAQLAEDGGALRAVDHWIYSFHMPFFFLLSGLFAERRVTQGFGSFLAQQLRTIAYPYFLWSALQTCVQVVFAGSTNRAAGWSELLSIPVAPPMQFWFLYVLFIVAVLYRVVRTVVPTPLLVFFGACALFAVQGFLPAGLWIMLLISTTFLPYFSLGAAVHGRAAAMAREVRPHWLFALAVVCLAGVTFATQRWPGVQHTEPLGIPIACLGIAGTLALSMAAAHSARLGVFALLGRASLQIFVAHTIASAGTRIVLSKLGVRDVTTHVVLGTIVGIACPLLLAKLVERYRIPYVFSWPAR